MEDMEGMDRVSAEEYARHGNDVSAIQRQIPDDCVDYAIYVIDASIQSEAQLRERLKEIEVAGRKLVKTHLEGYIWQRDEFRLSLADTSSPSKDSKLAGRQIGHGDTPLAPTAHLAGTTNFGDSIADEWAIVYVLRELSNMCKDIWISVRDGDGQFLLVEAANALPEWLDPEIAENRVWIHQGQLRIAAEEETPSRGIDLGAVIDMMRKQPLTLMRDVRVEQAAFSRLRDYPAAISQTFHHAMVTIPRRLAYVLHERPGCISAAVESFYLRNAVALKTLATKDTGTLYMPPEDFVTVSVKFTRVGYAQLLSQDFALPGSWSGISPHITEPRVLIGMKLGCGFEMLLQDRLNMDKQVVREVKLLLEDIESGEDKLPLDREVKTWSQRQDSDDWLDIKFDDLDRELKDRMKDGDRTGKNSADAAPEQKLDDMVTGFESFLGKRTGPGGVDEFFGPEDDDDDDDDDESSEPDSEGEDKAGSFNEAEFEQAMRDIMGLPAEDKEKNGLMDEARRLAMEMEDDEEIIEDEDEIRRLMEEMGAELNGLGALDLNGSGAGRRDKLPTSRHKGKGKATASGDSDDEPDELDWTSGTGQAQAQNDNSVLVKNLLQSLKGQGGMSGPTSNMLAAMGIRMPRDEDDDDDDDDEDDNLV